MPEIITQWNDFAMTLPCGHEHPIRPRGDVNMSGFLFEQPFSCPMCKLQWPMLQLKDYKSPARRRAEIDGKMFTCPRQMLTVYTPHVPFERGAYWRPFLDELHHMRDMNWPKWMPQIPEPRVCSSCGSIHPEDAIVLLQGQWELDKQKEDKFDLHPIGWHHNLGVSLRHIGAGLSVESLPKFEEPSPVVKIYMQHCTPRQCEQMNEILKRRQ